MVRILGVIKNGKKIVGYRLFEDKSYKINDCNVEIAYAHLSKTECSGVNIETGELVGDGIDIDKLTVLDVNLRVLGDSKLTILKRIVDGSKTIGYEVVDINGKVSNIKQVVAINYFLDRGLTNATVVNKDGKQFIRGIKKELPVLKLDKQEILSNKVKVVMCAYVDTKDVTTSHVKMVFEKVTDSKINEYANYARNVLGNTSNYSVAVNNNELYFLANRLDVAIKALLDTVNEYILDIVELTTHLDTVNNMGKNDSKVDRPCDMSKFYDLWLVDNDSNSHFNNMFIVASDELKSAFKLLRKYPKIDRKIKGRLIRYLNILNYMSNSCSFYINIELDSKHELIKHTYVSVDVNGLSEAQLKSLKSIKYMQVTSIDKHDTIYSCNMFTSTRTGNFEDTNWLLDLLRYSNTKVANIKIDISDDNEKIIDEMLIGDIDKYYDKIKAIPDIGNKLYLMYKEIATYKRITSEFKGRLYNDLKVLDKYKGLDD